MTQTRSSKRPANRRRRGTVLIFALGVLAVISITAVGYVAVVRIDRGSSAAVARNVNYQQQVEAVVDYMGSIMAADLFGDKIATTSIPREAWPSMFENSEYFDFPHIDRLAVLYPGGPPYTFNLSPEGQEPSRDSVLIYDTRLGLENGLVKTFEVSAPDDAWLASTEPSWFEYPSNGMFATENDYLLWWPQVTNLRSAYVYDTTGSTDISRHRWVRMDGRFADLGEFFEVPRNGYGNAGVDALRRDLAPDTIGALGPSSGVMPLLWAPPNGEHTAVFHKQMAALNTESESDPRVFTAADERFWADADGDLRPDSRWTELPALGNLFGLRWFVAARIIDASSMVNINTAMESGNELYGWATGRTPADVDLLRLLEGGFYGSYESGGGNIYQPRARFDKAVDAFREHTRDAIGFDQDFQNSLSDTNSSLTFLDLPFVKQSTFDGRWTSDLSIQNRTPLERAALYEYGTISPGNPLNSSIQSYPIRDMIDLHAFWGTNDDRVLSQIEQYADGPVVGGYVPDGSSDYTEIGPLWSRVPSTQSRVFSLDRRPDTQRPTLRELKTSIRRQLTTVSGKAPFSPVPVWPHHEDYEGVFTNELISLRNFQAERDIPRSFEAIAWALAPFSVEWPLLLDKQNNWVDFGDIANNDRRNYAYGGQGGPFSAVNGPARQFNDEADYIGDSSPAVRNDYAIYTAASLATNIADAIDDDDDPTITRFIPGREVYEDDTTPGFIELGTRTSWGHILEAHVYSDTDNPLLGVPAGQVFGSTNETLTDGFAASGGTASDKGAYLVGMDRQPFIREVATGAWYSDWPADHGVASGGGLGNGVIEGDDEHIGSYVAVELFNPWAEPIELNDDGQNWFFVLPALTSRIQGDSGGPEPVGFVLSNTIIPAGGAVTFTYVTGVDTNDDSATHLFDTNSSDDIGVDVLREFGGLNGGSLIRIEGTYPGSEMSFASIAREPVAFQNIANEQRQALLMYRADPGNGANSEFMLMDRIVPANGEVFPAAITGADFDLSQPCNQAPYSFLPSTYENLGVSRLDRSFYESPALLYRDTLTAGLDPPASLVRTGRILVTSSLTRPSIYPEAPGGAGRNAGFPSCVLGFNGWLNGRGYTTPIGELANANRVAHTIDAVSWIGVPGTNTAIASDIANLVEAIRDQPETIVGPENEVWTLEADLGDGVHWELGSFAPGAKDVDGAGTNRVGLSASMIPQFQLFVPNESLSSPADVGLVSINTHLCPANRLNHLDSLGWVLAGERMARSLRYDFGQITDTSLSQVTATSRNPFLGVLDTSRFILGGDLMEIPGYNFREQHRIPLALRVFDCFDALPRRIGSDGRSRLTQGIMNLNTASPEALATLPLVAPRNSIGNSSTLAMINGFNASYAEQYPLVYKMLGYREVFSASGPFNVPYPSFTESSDASVNLTGVPGLRAGITENRIEKMLVRGFVSHGEPLMLHQRTDNGMYPTYAPESQDPGGIQRLGIDGMDAGAPFEIWHQTAPGRTAAGGDNPAYGDNSFDPVDSVEERMALYRAISNVTSVRSDVFLAWFIVRGYDPDAIEQIPVGTGSPERQVAEAMDDPRFRPVFNKRYLAVFDRSNIRLPIDRPQLLMLVQVPSTSP